MNCSAQNRNAYLIAKFQGWREVANCGITKSERARALRNLKYLARTYPDIARDCGVAAVGERSNEKDA